MAPAVTIEGLSFSYGSQKALENIALTVARGTTLGIVGPNGGGKTTLAKLLLGILRPTSGLIRIAGLSPAMAVRRGHLIGYLPQHPPSRAALPLSVRQVVQLGLAGKTGLFRGRSAEDGEFVETLLHRVGVAHLSEKPVASLSGGQLQRVYIARALAPRPMLLLLDEPTTGIDTSGQQQFIELLQELKRELDLTVVLISHDLRAICSISDRIGCLNVTLHCHDVPDHQPPDVIYHMFACDFEAAGLRGLSPRDPPYVSTAPLNSNPT
jgi:zinc transport system ATP-binding protein